MEIENDRNTSECCICFETCLIIISCKQCKTCKICEKCIVSYMKIPQKKYCPCCKTENWRVFTPLPPRNLVLRNRSITRSDSSSSTSSTSSTSSDDSLSSSSSSDEESVNEAIVNVSEELQLLMDYTSNIGAIHNTYNTMQVIRYGFICCYYIWLMITIYIIFIMYYMLFNIAKVSESNHNFYMYMKCIYGLIIIWIVFKLKLLATNIILLYNSYRQLDNNYRERRTIPI
jgi:hypothetical protein